MLMALKIGTRIFLLTWVFSIVGCQPETRDITLGSEILKYTQRSFDPQSIIGSDYKIIQVRIKDHTVLMIANKHDTTFFLGVDLEDKRILFNVKDPINDYVLSRFDVNDTSIVSLSALGPKEIFITPIATKKTEK
jgi:hypothetical protein